MRRCALPRPGRDRHQVRLRVRCRRPGDRPQQPARAHPEDDRRVAEAASRRGDRPLLPAPGRSGRAHRGRGGRRAGSDRAGQGQALRAIGGRRRDPPSGARGAAGRRAAERVFAVVERARDERGARRHARSSGSGSCRSARSARDSSRGRSTSSTTFDSSDFRNIVPRFTAENRKANQAMVELLTRLATARSGQRRRRSRSRGSWRRSRGSCPSPAPPSCTGSRRTSAARPSSSGKVICARSTDGSRGDRSAWSAVPRAPAGAGGSLRAGAPGVIRPSPTWPGSAAGPRCTRGAPPRNRRAAAAG